MAVSTATAATAAVFGLTQQIYFNRLHNISSSYTQSSCDKRENSRARKKSNINASFKVYICRTTWLAAVVIVFLFKRLALFSKNLNHLCVYSIILWTNINVLIVFGGHRNEQANIEHLTIEMNNTNNFYEV